MLAFLEVVQEVYGKLRGELNQPLSRDTRCAERMRIDSTEQDVRRSITAVEKEHEADVGPSPEASAVRNDIQAWVLPDRRGVVRYHYPDDVVWLSQHEVFDDQGFVRAFNRLVHAITNSPYLGHLADGTYVHLAVEVSDSRIGHPLHPNFRSKGGPGEHCSFYLEDLREILGTE